MKLGLTVLAPVQENLRKDPHRMLYGGRMIAYSAPRQLAVMIGFAAGRNAIAAWLHRKVHPPATLQTA